MFENFDLINDDLHIEDCNCDVEQHFDSPTMQNTSSMGVSPTYENDSNGGVIVTDIFGENLSGISTFATIPIITPIIKPKRAITVTPHYSTGLIKS